MSTRCPDCDAPLAGPSDLPAGFSAPPRPEDSLLCWRLHHGDMCQRPAVDWRAMYLQARRTIEDDHRIKTSLEAEANRAASEYQRQLLAAQDSIAGLSARLADVEANAHDRLVAASCGMQRAEEQVRELLARVVEIERERDEARMAVDVVAEMFREAETAHADAQAMLEEVAAERDFWRDVDRLADARIDSLAVECGRLNVGCERRDDALDACAARIDDLLRDRESLYEIAAVAGDELLHEREMVGDLLADLQRVRDDLRRLSVRAEALMVRDDITRMLVLLDASTRSPGDGFRRRVHERITHEEEPS